MTHDLACAKALINLLFYKENHPFNLLMKTKKDNQINIGAKPISKAHKTEKRKPSRSFKLGSTDMETIQGHKQFLKIRT